MREEKMNSLYRREFLKHVASTLAISTAGLTFESCSTIRAAYRQSQGDVDIDEIMACLKKQTESIAEDEGLRYAEDYYRECGCNPYILQDSLISLLAAGTFGDLPEKQRQHPRVQQMLWDRAPVMNRAVLCTATYLENLTPEERLKIQKALKEHPEILKTFQVEFDAAARRQNVPSNRLDHFSAIFNQCAWRLENQDPSLLIDNLVAITDKVGQQCCITPEERRRVALKQSTASCFDFSSMDKNVKGNINPYNVSIDNHEELKQAKSNSSNKHKFTPYEVAKKRMQTGLKIMGYSLIPLGLGAILVFSGNFDAAMIGAFLGLTPGAVIFLVGMIVAIVGAAGMGKNK
jgi:hypothetical protein